MDLLDSLTSMEEVRQQLEKILKPFQLELNRRQKKSDFIKKCNQCIEKNDFFQLDELLKSQQMKEVLEEADLESCSSIFSQLQAYANQKIEQYTTEFKSGLIQTADKVGLTIKVDLPLFFVTQGIEGEVNFAKRQTRINELTLKSFDPKRIVSIVLNFKRKLYAPVFEPQLFIDSLWTCYQEILKKDKQGIGDSVSIYQLYTDYVWSLQSKAFLQNMDKSKFKGYSTRQFAVDLWRFFTSDVCTTSAGFCLRLAPGRIKSMELFDPTGEKRLISHASFAKRE